MNTGLLILRLVIGLLFAGHGIQKISHWLGGHGIEGGAAEFRADGFRGGRLTAAAAGLGQIAAGLLLAAGALTPLAAAIAAGVMTVAVTVKWRNGLWVQDNGYEYPLVLVILPAVLTLTGPGRWSADQALGLLPWDPWWTVVAVGLGVAGGLMTRVFLGRPSGESEGTSVPPRS
ncbi:DoxX family protein [Streptomyces yaanensis]|uniref:DoxX family protein n=1 Tax=Streptomyces yaanensis TaxID=1142239 RepID=A0ABV7SH45_9ACTN|nr:DoxX family protein [Streptomyces sp. CGMCC 4.7035]WNB97885.1 DoxX family protein [Streptomyces sp. CGMCC 4.7035]